MIPTANLSVFSQADSAFFQSGLVFQPSVLKTYCATYCLYIFQVVFVLDFVTSKNKTKISIDAELLTSTIQERPQLWDQPKKKYNGFTANAGDFARLGVASRCPAQLGFGVQ